MRKQIRASRWTKARAAISQLICVIVMDGHENEMLSSYAWRTQNKKLISWLDWLLGKDHCQQSYEWETERDAIAAYRPVRSRRV
jgi:hypothetical protein